MAPTSYPCLPPLVDGGGDDDANSSSLHDVLDMVKEQGARVLKNASLLYNDFKETTNSSLERHPYIFGNVTSSSADDELIDDPAATRSMSCLHEFQIIKAVVLAIVTVVILISICKMVFQLFVRYTVKHDK